MNRKTHIDMFGVVALIAIALNFGLNQIVIKFSNGGFQPLFMACLRSAGAGIVLLIWMRIRKIPFFYRVPVLFLEHWLEFFLHLSSVFYLLL